MRDNEGNITDVKDEQRRERAEWRERIQMDVYNALYSAGDICRMRVSQDPDLTESIAKGIIEFLSDGEVLWSVLWFILNNDITKDVISHFAAGIVDINAEDRVNRILDSLPIVEES